MLHSVQKRGHTEKTISFQIFFKWFARVDKNHLRRAEGGNLPVRLRSIRGSARPHSARQRRDCTPHWPSHCPAFPPDPPASASLTIVRLCLCALGRHSASPTTCQCAARRPQARPKVRPRRRTARAPPKRPRRVSRRASARTLASLLLTHHFRRSTDASTFSVQPGDLPDRVRRVLFETRVHVPSFGAGGQRMGSAGSARARTCVWDCTVGRSLVVSECMCSVSAACSDVSPTLYII